MLGTDIEDLRVNRLTYSEVTGEYLKEAYVGQQSVLYSFHNNTFEKSTFGRTSASAFGSRIHPEIK